LKLQKQIQNLERQIAQRHSKGGRGSRGSPRKLAMKRNASASNNYRKLEGADREHRKSTPNFTTEVKHVLTDQPEIKPVLRDRSHSASHNVPRLWINTTNDT